MNDSGAQSEKQTPVATAGPHQETQGAKRGPQSGECNSPWAGIVSADRLLLVRELGQSASSALSVWYELNLQAFVQQTTSPTVSGNRLAHATGVTRLTVRKRLADLERLGFLSAERQRSSSAGDTDNVYHLLRGYHPWATATPPVVTHYPPVVTEHPPVVNKSDANANHLINNLKEKNPPLPPGGGGNGSFASPGPDPKTPPRAEPRRNKAARVVANTGAMIRIGTWFSRRATTLWSQGEAETLAAINPDEDELATLEAYYMAAIPPADSYRRHEVATLLNNWTGELDRARAFVAKSTPKSSSCPEYV